ncbi:hypothetical protein ACOMHN_007469 [Nucella lapillus]
MLANLRPPRLLNQYSQKQMQAAMEAVIENRISVKDAVKEFGVPRSSLYEKLKKCRSKSDSDGSEDPLTISRPFPSNASSSSTLSPRWGLGATAFPSFTPTGMSQIQHPAFSALSRSFWMSGGMANYKPRPRLQYTADQISTAIQDVDMGKSISKAAKDNGVPFTSLYRKVKARNSSLQSEEPQRASAEESFPSAESLPSLDAISADISFLNNQKSELDETPEGTNDPNTQDRGLS